MFNSNLKCGLRSALLATYDLPVFGSTRGLSASSKACSVTAIEVLL